ncbi:MAG: 4Fe-4S binding protein [Desulfobacterales bacterium]|nr:4Fe-4S binding protein [Desulfobacterales bacterium]
MASANLLEKRRNAAGVICRQGVVRFPASDTALAIIERVVGDDEEALDLIAAFNAAPSQTPDQLAASSGFSEEKVAALADDLAEKGLIFNQPNSAGVMVYRLLPLMLVGLMEYKFMVPVTGSPAEKELARLFETLLAELRDQTQESYDSLAPLFRQAPAVDRTVPVTTTESGASVRVIPVAKSIPDAEEFVLPTQRVEEIIDKFDDIAVGHCFCRQRRSLLGEPCTINAPTFNCFTFGKSARHTAAHGFAKMVSKEEARRIMKEAEDAGLIHKAFHPGGKEARPETSICNCCKDCCDTLRLWRSGTMPLINSTYYLSVVDEDACTGCGSCEERCPTEAIVIGEDGVARRDEAACLGCGVCARFCPEEAISLQEGYRRVFVMPPRLRNT